MGLPSVTEMEVLERVDEYSLYCFYLEYDPVVGDKYTSPLRTGDDDPSFGVFVRRVNRTFPTELMWKDNAKVGQNFGDIFDLVQYMFNLQSRTAGLWRIAMDFKITKADGTISSAVQWIHKEPKYKEPIDIRIKSGRYRPMDLEYWAQFGVTLPILQAYNTHRVEAYWMTKNQRVGRFPKQCYAYQIFNKYQLYQPFERKYKFRTDWTDVCVPGMAQTKPGPLLIHTKAMKDVMTLRSLGFTATAARGENMLPDPRFNDWAKRNFNRTVVLFDNDGKTGADLYPFESVIIPDGLPKDPSDYRKEFGHEATLELLKRLLNV